MKTITIILLTIIAQIAFSQAVSKEKAKIYLKNGDIKKGTILIESRTYAVGSLQFFEDNASTPATLTPTNTYAIIFETGETIKSIYTKMVINAPESRDKLKASPVLYDSLNIFVYEQIKGKISLYVNSQQNIFHFFVQKDGGSIEELLFYYLALIDKSEYNEKENTKLESVDTREYSSNFKTIKKEYYKGQLVILTEEHPTIVPKIYNCEFTTKDLEKIVRLYNSYYEQTNTSSVQHRKQKKIYSPSVAESNLYISALTGYNMMTFSGDLYDLNQIKSNNSPIFGGMITFKSSFDKDHKYATCIEIGLYKHNSKASNTFKDIFLLSEKTVKYEADAIILPIQVSEQFKISKNQNTNTYLNLGFNVNININPKVTVTMLDTERKYTTSNNSLGFFGGMGFCYKSFDFKLNGGYLIKTLSGNSAKTNADPSKQIIMNIGYKVF